MPPDPQPQPEPQAGATPRPSPHVDHPIARQVVMAAQPRLTMAGLGGTLGFAALVSIAKGLLDVAARNSGQTVEDFARRNADAIRRHIPDSLLHIVEVVAHDSQENPQP